MQSFGRVCICKLSYFEWWARFVAGLENDEYVRQIEGYLPTAEVAFIDEIFKANSAILNALLTLLNERLFDNGHRRLLAPLLTLVGGYLENMWIVNQFNL